MPFTLTCAGGLHGTSITLRLTKKVECLGTRFWLPVYYLTLITFITQINIFDLIT